MLFYLWAGYQLSENKSVEVGADNIFNTDLDEATIQEMRGLISSRGAPYHTDDGQFFIRLGVHV